MRKICPFAATANGQFLRIRVSPVPSTQARRRALPRPPNALHAAVFDQFSFKDDSYRTDVAAAGKVYRQFAGGRSRSPISILAIQTIQTPQVSDTSPIQAPGSFALGVAHAESDVPGCRIQAVSSQAFTSEGLWTEVVAEGADAQKRAQARREGGPPCGRPRALSARARINEPEHLRLGHRKQCHLYLSRDARGRGLRPGSAVLAGKLARFHPSRRSAAVSGGTGISIER